MVLICSNSWNFIRRNVFNILIRLKIKYMHRIWVVTIPNSKSHFCKPEQDQIRNVLKEQETFWSWPIYTDLSLKQMIGRVPRYPHTYSIVYLFIFKSYYEYMLNLCFNTKDLSIFTHQAFLLRNPRYFF